MIISITVRRLSLQMLAAAAECHKRMAVNERVGETLLPIYTDDHDPMFWIPAKSEWHWPHVNDFGYGK